MHAQIKTRGKDSNHHYLRSQKPVPGVQLVKTKRGSGKKRKFGTGRVMNDSTQAPPSRFCSAATIAPFTLRFIRGRPGTGHAQGNLKYLNSICCDL